MMRLLGLLALALVLCSCGTPTPIADIDAASLVALPDDGATTFRPGTVQTQLPDFLRVAPPAERVASLDVRDQNVAVGVTTALIYATPAQAHTAYTVLAQANTVVDLGDAASTDSHEAAFGETQHKVLDLVVLRCRTVMHLRFLRTALAPDAAKAYARAMDTRVQALGC